MGRIKKISFVEGMTDVVFVSGVFNILHPGHRRFLDFAESQKKQLIIGVFSDIMAAKSAYMPEDVRLAAVKAYSKKARVILVDTDLKQILNEVRPSLVIKGPEFKDIENIESIILSWGGQLIFSAGNEKTGVNVGTGKIDFRIPWDSKEIRDYVHRRNISKPEIVKIIENFKNINVLTIGDVILDIYQYCRPLGLSKEDPTIVVQPTKEEKFLGGAGIVAAHARALNAESRLISVVGKDRNNLCTTKLLTNYDVNNSIIFDSSRKTTTKTRLKCEGKTLLRISDLIEANISNDKISEVINQINMYVSSTDLIILSDFNYGILPPKLVEEIIKIKGLESLVVTADSQSSSQFGDISRFKEMDLITPTEHEARLALNDKESGIVSLSYKLIQKSKAKNLFITLGGDGVLIQDGKNIKSADGVDRLPAFSNNCRDNSGAGDSMLTAASLALAQGADIWHSAFIGSIAAGIQVSSIGNKPISSESLIEAMYSCAS
jgi:rfaE bifunctional protein kinase chain/domain